MIKIRDISILGLLGVVQFFVLSETFHWHYSVFIAYACFCLGYIFYKLGCDADPFWTIGRKLLYWAPIVVAICANMIYYVCDELISYRILLFSAIINLFGIFVLSFYRYRRAPIVENDIFLYVLSIAFEAYYFLYI